jgi:branched-chain amino acid aminotransferase
MPPKAHIDGAVLDLEQARLPVTDHGFLFGDSVFETLRALGFRCAFEARHLQRLRRSADACRLAIPWTDAEIARAMDDTLRASGERDAALRIIVTRGSGPPEPDPMPCREPRLVVIARARRPLPEALLLDGADVVVARCCTSVPGAHAKTGNYLTGVLALAEARDAGAFEAILLNREGRVTECAGSNLFVARGGEVVTPPVEEGLLEGISRRAVLESCGALGIPCAERPLWPGEVASSDEAFLTSTLKEIVPIRSIDGRLLGRPGSVTRALMAAHRERLARETE